VTLCKIPAPNRGDIYFRNYVADTPSPIGIAPEAFITAASLFVPPFIRFGDFVLPGKFQKRVRRSYQFTKNGLEALGSSLDGCMWIGLVVGHAPPSLAMRHGMPEEGCSMVSGGIRGIRAQMRPKILTEKRFPINFRGSEDKPNDHHQYAHRRLYYVKFTFKIRQSV
jgi:hypothetical protein